MPASETLSSRRFDKIAENFATSEVHRSSPTMAALHETLGPQKGSAICDVACGAGHLALVETIERRLAALPGLFLAGGAYRGVGIADCVRSGEAAAEAARESEG